jgi:hypothetical protein
MNSNALLLLHYLKEVIIRTILKNVSVKLNVTCSLSFIL